MVARHDTRGSLGRVFRAASTPKISIPLFTIALYVTAVVAGLSFAGIWTWDLLSETAFWFAGTALVLFMSYERASKDPRFFRRATLRVLSATVVLEFIVNLYPLALIAELALVPSLVFLGAMLAVSQLRSDLAQVKGCLQGIIAVTGFLLLGYSAIRAVGDPGSLANIGNARELATPIFLTASLLPLVYGLTVYGTYDGLLIRLRLQLGGETDVYRYGRRQLWLNFGLRLRSVLRASRAPWRLMLSQSPSKTEMDRVIDHIKSRQPNAVATSLQTENDLRQISTAQPPGWEYQLFARQLGAGAMAIAHSHASFDETGRAFDLPRNARRAIETLQADGRGAIELVSGFERILGNDRVVQAFGAPGEPGNAEYIRDLAEELVLNYDRMLQWTERARATRAVDQLATLVQIHAELLDRANRQVDDYIDRWTSLDERLPELLIRAEQSLEPIELEMSLVLTVEDHVIARFTSETERLRRAA